MVVVVLGGGGGGGAAAADDVGDGGYDHLKKCHRQQRKIVLRSAEVALEGQAQQ